MKNVAEEYKNRVALLKNLLCTTCSIVEKNKIPKGAEGARSYEDELKKNHKKGDGYVYIIFWENGSAEEIATKFQKEKDKKVYSLPRNNYNFKADSKDDENKVFDENKVLYVGSSKDITTRLGQHFSDNVTKTYALYLPTWAENLDNFKVFAANLSDDLECVEDKDKRFALTIIEDILADIYKPLLGKRGPNTK